MVNPSEHEVKEPPNVPSSNLPFSLPFLLLFRPFVCLSIDTKFRPSSSLSIFRLAEALKDFCFSLRSLSLALSPTFQKSSSCSIIKMTVTLLTTAALVLVHRVEKAEEGIVDADNKGSDTT